MIHRKGEVTHADLEHEWPHHVALPAGKVRGVKNSKVILYFAVRRPYRRRRSRTPCVAMTATSCCSALLSRKTRRLVRSTWVGSSTEVTPETSGAIQGRFERSGHLA
jgi:hypothetical protein